MNAIHPFLPILAALLAALPLSRVNADETPGAPVAPLAIAEISSFSQLQSDVTALGLAVGQPALPMGLLGAGTLVASPGLLGIDRERPMRIALYANASDDEDTPDYANSFEVVAVPLAEPDGASYLRSVEAGATKTADADGYRAYELNSSFFGDAFQVVIADGWAYLSFNATITEAQLRAVAAAGPDVLAVPDVRGTIRFRVSAPTLAEQIRSSVTDEIDVPASLRDLGARLLDLLFQTDRLALGLDYAAGRGLSLWTRTDARPGTDAAGIIRSLRSPDAALLAAVSSQDEAVAGTFGADPALLQRLAKSYVDFLDALAADIANNERAPVRRVQGRRIVSIVEVSPDVDDDANVADTDDEDDTDNEDTNDEASEDEDCEAEGVCANQLLDFLRSLLPLLRQSTDSFKFIDGTFAESTTIGAEGNPSYRIAFGSPDPSSLHTASRDMISAFRDSDLGAIVRIEELPAREVDGLSVERARISYDFDALLARTGVDPADAPDALAAQLAATKALYAQLGKNTLESTARNGVVYGAWAPGDTPLDGVLAAASKTSDAPADPFSALFPDIPDLPGSVAREFVDYARLLPAILSSLPRDTIDPDDADLAALLDRIRATPDRSGLVAWRNADSLLTVVRLEENAFLDIASVVEFVIAHAQSGLLQQGGGIYPSQDLPLDDDDDADVDDDAEGEND